MLLFQSPPDRCFSTPLQPVQRRKASALISHILVLLIWKQHSWNELDPCFLEEGTLPTD